MKIQVSGTVPQDVITTEPGTVVYLEVDDGLPFPDSGTGKKVTGLFKELIRQLKEDK